MSLHNEQKENAKQDTILAQAGSLWDTRTGGISMPVVHSSTFRHPGPEQSTGFDYARTASPTRSVLEDVMAKLDNADSALAFSSGLAAIECAFHVFEPGSKVVVFEDLYGGTFRLLEASIKRQGIELVYLGHEAFLKPEEYFPENYDGVFFETPTNPVLRETPIKPVVKHAHERGALVLVDNTFSTPVRLKPIDHGVDVVVYSASKFIGGHNDVVAGVLTISKPELSEKLAYWQNTQGSILGPQDSWLLLRGLKTLSIRMDRSEQTAVKLALWLKNQEKVNAVYYPGHGGMLSFELTESQWVNQFLETVKIWLFAESLGGTESLITFPAVQTHADVPVEKRAELGVSDSLLRCSVGLEDVDDLIDDFKNAFEVLK